MFPTARVDTDDVIPLPPPGDDDDSPAITEKLHKVLSKLRMRRVITDADASALSKAIARPGSAYPRYRNKTQLPESAKVFYEATAKVIGVSLETMVSAVYQTENRIMHPERNRSRTRDGSRSRSRSTAKSQEKDDERNVASDESE